MNDYPKYEKLKIVVFTENEKDEQMYFNLFKFLMADHIETETFSNNKKMLGTSRADFYFYRGLLSAKGHRCHYIINLTQNKEFDMHIKHIEFPMQNDLKKDERWEQLFTNL